MQAIVEEKNMKVVNPDYLTEKNIEVPADAYSSEDETVIVNMYFFRILKFTTLRLRDLYWL